jgi:hypothetical protein
VATKFFIIATMISFLGTLKLMTGSFVFMVAIFISITAVTDFYDRRQLFTYLLVQI